MTKRFLAPITAVMLLASAIPVPAQTQTYPNRVIKVIAPNPPGGLGDLIARTFGDYVTSQTGQPVVIENRSGANGNIAWETTAKSPPDGYTIGLVNTGVVINKFMFKSLHYDVYNDLVPVAPIGAAPQLFFISAKLPLKTLPEFVAYAKAQPRKLTYASAGIGSTVHLSGSELSRRTGTNLVHVPYRGVAPAITDVMADHVDSIAVSIGPILPAVDSKMVRPLFSLTSKRLSYFPDVPASAEVGLPGLDMSTWFALMAPRGTPPAIVERLNALVRGMHADPTAQKRLETSRLEPMVMTTAEFAAFLKAEGPKWADAVRQAGIEAKD